MDNTKDFLKTVQNDVFTDTFNDVLKGEFTYMGKFFFQAKPAYS